MTATPKSLNLGARQVEAKPDPWSEAPAPDPLSLKTHLPQSLDNSNWSQFPLIGGEFHGVECVNLEVEPQVLFAGRSGTGKSTALLTVATQALSRGFDLVVVDTTTHALDLLPVLPFARRTATNRSDAQHALEELAETIHLRLETLAEEGVNRWDKSAQRMKPTLVVIDTVDDLLFYQGSSDYNVSYRLDTILRLGRATGVHLAVSSNQPEKLGMGDQLRVFKLGTGGTQGSARVLTMSRSEIPTALDRIGVPRVPADEDAAAAV